MEKLLMMKMFMDSTKEKITGSPNYDRLMMILKLLFIFMIIGGIAGLIYWLQTDNIGTKIDNWFKQAGKDIQKFSVEVGNSITTGTNRAAHGVNQTIASTVDVKEPKKGPCPDNTYEDVFGNCKKSSYGNGAGYALWDKKKCEDESTTGGCRLEGALYYPFCKDGYSKNGLFCTAEAQEVNFNDRELSCPPGNFPNHTILMKNVLTGRMGCFDKILKDK